MEKSLVPPLLPSGNKFRIEIPGLDLWVSPRIDNLFIYSDKLDLNRLKEALGHALSLWPLVCGQFSVVDNKKYFIEMSDNAIPFTYIENTDLTRWPHNENVVLDSTCVSLHSYLDEVRTEQLLQCSFYEPLFRLKVTRIAQSEEWVLGTSWAHVLGDAQSCLNFLHTISCFYQNLPLPDIVPVFQRRLWYQEEGDPLLLYMMRHLTDAILPDENAKRMINEQLTHDQLNIHFTGEQLARLHSMSNDEILTTHDMMVAYIIFILNNSCFQTENEIIRHTNFIINYRGVSDSIAPVGLMANCTLRMLSENFDDPYSLLNIAKSIRNSVRLSRDPKFLENWLGTADGLMRNMIHLGREVNIDHFSNGIIVNSNFRYDWAQLFDLGQTGKCRFHTDGTSNLFLRIFRLNPVYNDGQWSSRDCHGAEVAFRINKNIKTKFIEAWERDVRENFINVIRK